MIMIIRKFLVHLEDFYQVEKGRFATIHVNTWEPIFPVKLIGGS